MSRSSLSKIASMTLLAAVLGPPSWSRGPAANRASGPRQPAEKRAMAVETMIDGAGGAIFTNMTNTIINYYARSGYILKGLAVDSRHVLRVQLYGEKAAREALPGWEKCPPTRLSFPQGSKRLDGVIKTHFLKKNIMIESLGPTKPVLDKGGKRIDADYSETLVHVHNADMYLTGTFTVDGVALQFEEGTLTYSDLSGIPSYADGTVCRVGGARYTRIGSVWKADPSGGGSGPARR